MVSIQLKTHVGSDGQLNLQVPTDLRETDVEVLVVLQPVKTIPGSTVSDDLGWPRGFFQQTAGAWQGEPLVRGEQGEYEAREDLK